MPMLMPLPGAVVHRLGDGGIGEVAWDQIGHVSCPARF
jgi:predicted ATPase